MTRTPGDEPRRLQALAGEWTGEEQLAVSRWSPGGPATARVSARMALGGYYLVQDYVERMEGRTTIQVQAVFAWDEERRQYLLYWFDSHGYAPQQPGSGQWEGDTLTLTRVSSRGMARHHYRIEGSEAYTLKIENSFDDGASWEAVMEGRYLRAGN